MTPGFAAAGLFRKPVATVRDHALAFRRPTGAAFGRAAKRAVPTAIGPTFS
jgi:hypothetical protein